MPEDELIETESEEIPQDESDQVPPENGSETLPGLNELSPEELESPRIKGILKSFTQDKQKIAPLRKLMEETGADLDSIRAAVSYYQAAQNSPADVLKDLATRMPGGIPEAIQHMQPPSVGPKVMELAESLGAEPTSLQAAIDEVSQGQVKTLRQEQENQQYIKACGDADKLITGFLAEKSGYGLTQKAIQDALYQTMGPKGISRGVTPKDLEKAALEVLGPEAYGEAVYKSHLDAARKKVKDTTPSLVVTPSTPAGTVAESPGFDRPKDLKAFAEAYSKKYKP